jgi:carrier protein
MTPLYPMRFVHTLIQLGYEPVPPERRFSIVFQRYMYYWPGIVGYARAIARQDGWLELYRGVSGSFATDVTGILASALLNPTADKIVAKIPLSVVPDNGDTPDNEDNIVTTRAILVRGVRMFCKQLMVRSAVIIITQPFQTVTIRMIAQHVGKETIYDTVWGAFREIYQREGVAGFYKGVVPALLGGVLSIVMNVTLWVSLELVMKMITQEAGKTVIRSLVRPFLMSYVPRSYAYPFELMRAVLSANDSGLKIGSEPYAPKFDTWRDCYHHLKAQHVMYRGSVFFLPRYAYTERPRL